MNFSLNLMNSCVLSRTRRYAGRVRLVQLLVFFIACWAVVFAAKAIADLREAEDFIRTSIVVAEMNDEGAYGETRAALMRSVALKTPGHALDRLPRLILAAMAVEDRHVGRESPHVAQLQLPAWIQVGEDTITVDVHVQPGASSTEWCGEYSAARAKVRLAARPEDNKANAALLEFVAESMGVSKDAVSLVRGRASREKSVEVEGVSAEHALQVIGFEPELPETRSPGLQLQPATDAASGNAKDPGACGCSDHDHEHEELGTAIRV